MSERWRDTYDQWKLRTPEEEAERRRSRFPEEDEGPDPDYLRDVARDEAEDER